MISTCVWRTDRQMVGPTDGPTEGPMDIPSYRDAGTHLLSELCSTCFCAFFLYFYGILFYWPPYIFYTFCHLQKDTSFSKFSYLTIFTISSPPSHLLTIFYVIIQQMLDNILQIDLLQTSVWSHLTKLCRHLLLQLWKNIL